MVKKRKMMAAAGQQWSSGFTGKDGESEDTPIAQRIMAAVSARLTCVPYLRC